MQVSTANDVKIYNLSSGKSIPEWLTDRQRRKLEQKNLEVRRRIQLIQDFDMPDVSHTIDVSPDGRYIFASGTYKPFLKCFDLKNLSLKFERGLDADVIRVKILSEDYTKLVILEDDRYVEMHAGFGRYFRLRIPKPGRDMDYCKESADLYIVGSTSEIYRLNLEEGVFLEPLVADAAAVNCCQFSDAHQLFMAGTSVGTIEAWDHRDRRRVGLLDVMGALKGEVQEIAQVTAVRWAGPLQLGAGTSSGHTLLYDIRTSRPLIVKDQSTGLPIKKLDFVSRENDSDLVLSMDSRVLKAWDRDTGKPFSAIEPETALNDFVRYPNSGLILMACESQKMLQYFVPAFGTAPKWCAYLETITEELEETSQPAVYDDYKFVTATELDQIGLSHLIGTNLLRAYMHGYFMDVRLYNKAVTLTQPFAFDKYKERRLMEEVDKEREASLIKKKKEKLPKVNAELALKLRAEADTKTEGAGGRKKRKEKKKAESASTILQDDRFSKLFQSEDFQVDEDSEAFTRAKAAVDSSAKKKKNKGRRADEGEESVEEESGEEREEQVDLSELRLAERGDEEMGTSTRRDRDEMDSDIESNESGSEEEEEDEEESTEKKKQNEKRKEMRKIRQAARSAFAEREKEMRAASRPTKFTLHEMAMGETISKFMGDDEEDEEAAAPLSLRKAALEEAGEMDDGREEDTPFGGKTMTFSLKKKSTKQKEAEADRAARHVQERKEERRKIGAVRKMMTPLPGNLVLNFGEARGRGGRGGGRGRGRGRGGTKRM